jgi:hypothetical protein
MRAAKGTFFLMSSATLRGSLSAYVAVMRKSILSVSDPIVLLMGLVGSRHLCTILVATRVSFSAFTRMFLALLTEIGSSFNSICNSTGRSKLSTLCSCLARRDKGSTVMVGPDLYRVSTIEVRSEVSCIFHVFSMWRAYLCCSMRKILFRADDPSNMLFHVLDVAFRSDF